MAARQGTINVLAQAMEPTNGDGLVESMMHPRSFNNQELDYPINRIVIGDRLRQIRDQEKVASIAQSMREVGQISAVVLLPDGELVAGAHRVAAAKLLGWKDIRAVIKEIDELDARLIEIDENLYRADLSVLEQAEHIQEREEILQAKGLRAQRGENRYTLDRGGTIPPLSTTADIAEGMGLSESSVQKRKQIASGITLEVREQIRDTDLANSTGQLLALARMEPEAQKAVVDLVQSGAVETVKQATAWLNPAAARILPNVHFSSETPEHYTPDEILAAVVACMGGIDLDPCSNSHETPNVPAALHYTRADDGLSLSWQGCVFMNPPYGNEIDPWIAKLVSEYKDGAVTEAIALVPARTDTQWWQRLRDYHICFVTGRLAFKGAGNNESAPFPSAVVYLGNETDRFVNAFEGIGDVWHRTRHGFCFGE